MAKADSMLSMPPTNTPVDTTRRFETLKDAEDALMGQGFKLVPDTCNWIDDAAQIDAGVYPVEEAHGVSKYRIEYRALVATPTRRRFLTVAAIGSMIGAGSLAAAAMAPNVPAAVTIPLAPATAGPAALQDPVIGLIEAHRKAEAVHLASLRELERLEKAGIEDSDVSEQPCHAEFEAFDALLAAGATTLPGLIAKLFYLQDIANREAWMLNDRPDAAIHLLEGFMASVMNVWAVQS
jgi:hypothetical protein